MTGSAERDATWKRVWAALDARQSGITVSPPPFSEILARAQGQPPTPPSGPPLALPSIGPGAGPGSAGSVGSAAQAWRAPDPARQPVRQERAARRQPDAGGSGSGGNGIGRLGKAVRVGLAVAVLASASVVAAFFRDEIRCAFAVNGEATSGDECDPSTESTLRDAAQALIGSLESGTAGWSPHIPDRCSAADIEAGSSAVRGANVEIDDVRVIGSGGIVDVSFVSGRSTETASISWIFVGGRWVISVCGALDLSG